jgi:PKHD-type hydroxylase
MVYPIVPNTGHTKDSLIFWEDFFTPEEINAILAFPEWVQAKQARIGYGEGEVNDEKRRTQVAWLPINQNTNWVYEKIAQTISKVNGMYYQFELTGLYEDIQLGIYSENEQGHYNWHVDGDGPTTPRKLSMSLLLSDPSEFEGGQLQVKMHDDDAISVEQSRGRAWFFPSYTLHRVTPVTKGIRRSLVVWAGGPKFK